MVIVGGGPTGLMLAGELALAGVDVAIVERRANQGLAGSRAGGLHSRTIGILDQRGIADRFLSQGQVFQVVHFHVPLDVSDFPTRHNYVLGLWQNHIERILAEWVGELAVPTYPGREVRGFVQDDTGVDVALSGQWSLATSSMRWRRKLIRKAAGIKFRGWDPTTSWLIAEVEMAEEPKWGVHKDAVGIHAIGKVKNGRLARVVLTEPQLRLDSEPALHDVSEALVAVYGTSTGIHSPTWISRFTDVTRQAAVYRDRRVLLAGDAAHVHPPVGGQGPQPRCAGCGESGMEAGPGGEADITGNPPRYLSRRAPPSRCPRIAQHDGAGCASSHGRPLQRLGRHRFRTPWHGRASQTARRGDIRSGHSLRPRRGARARRTPSMPTSTWSA